jgi:hypothetical protein
VNKSTKFLVPTAFRRKSSERDSATEREVLETFIEILPPRYFVELPEMELVKNIKKNRNSPLTRSKFAFILVSER